MRRPLLVAFRRNEIYVVCAVIAVLFVVAMGSVAWMLRYSFTASPYETVSEKDLENVFATGYVRFREDDGTPYLKVEVHNGTLWWIKKLEFTFDGVIYSLSDSDAFRPLHFGALRCVLEKAPPKDGQREYDLTIVKAYGYPPGNRHIKNKSQRTVHDIRLLSFLK